jgi:general secretion pathway protein G
LLARPTPVPVTTMYSLLAPPAACRAAQRGMTLLELMLAMTLLGVLTTLAVSGYGMYVRRAQLSQVVADMSEIQLAISRYDLREGFLPDSLDEIGFGDRRDPWGGAYQFLNFEGLKGVGSMRKDRNLVPINTDYDLYSMGPDGESRAPLTAKASRDDIVRANDGRYIGPAEEY